MPRFTTTLFTTTVSAKRITRFLFGTIAVLGIAHLIGLSLACLTHNSAVINVAKLVNVDRERNIPTLFNVFLLLFNAVLFFIIDRARRDFRHRSLSWLLLGSVFALLGFDEFGSLHEELSDPIRNSLSTTGGVLHYAWLIPYGIAAAVLAIVILPTIIKLPINIRKWFLIATIAYVAGAVGFEMLGGLFYRLSEEPNFFYGLLTGAEELLEMSGLTILSYALLLMIEQQYGGLTIVIPNQHSTMNQDYQPEIGAAGRRIEFTYLEEKPRSPSTGRS